MSNKAKCVIDENDLTAAYMAGLADRDDALRKACVAAAAKALREAIEALQDGWKVNEVFGAAAAVERLRARADAIEKGEA